MIHVTPSIKYCNIVVLSCGSVIIITTVTFCIHYWPYFQILLFAFLKVIEEGSHMVMMECPDTVNTLLHEFFLWEPDMSRKDSNKTDTEKTAPLSDLAPPLKINKPVDK